MASTNDIARYGGYYAAVFYSYFAGLMLFKPHNRFAAGSEGQRRLDRSLPRRCPGKGFRLGVAGRFVGLQMAHGQEQEENADREQRKAQHYGPLQG